ncbi:MAG: hypothetical protein M3Y57_14675, partial [Acidobacteriota bacterium]|nr:hypothetical protein [Acidobacteriota bacterium]
EQILQETDRRGLHLAQVLQMALRRDAAPKFPEGEYAAVDKTPAVPLSIVAGAATAIGVGLWWRNNKVRQPGDRLS